MSKDSEDYEEKLRKLLASLSQKDADAFRKLLTSLPGSSLEDVSRQFDATRARIRHIEQRALGKLKGGPGSTK
jgi:DNA-directed RNA polymerase sigma subunit (sigma70/sigma32)